MTLRKVERGTERRRAFTGLAGVTNSGKTYTSLELATGICEGIGANKGIAQIDTERRGHYYEDDFSYDRWEMTPPHSPKAWLEALKDLDIYDVVIIDSWSELHEGIGGLCEMAAESTNPNDVAKWAGPKAENKRLLNSMRNMNAQYIFCMRANPDKIEIVKGQREPNRLGLTPICQKYFEYDLTFGYLLDANSDGRARLWKKVKNIIPFTEGDQLSRTHGRYIAAWIKGETVQQPSRPLEGLLTIRHGDQIIYQGKDASAALAAYGPVARDLAGEPNGLAELRVQNFGTLQAMLVRSKGDRATYLQAEIAGVQP